MEQNMNKASLTPPSLWVLFLLIGFPQISETIYSPALPDIAVDLATNNSFVQWTLSLYFIGFALGVLIWGWVSDHTGRRPAMFAGLFVYLIASILCLSATSIQALLIYRLLQGLGASCGSVVTQAIARESLNEHRRYQFYAMAGFIMALAITLGPLIGGYLTRWFAWQANFYFLAIMGVSLIVLSFLKLPETRIVQRGQRGTSILQLAKRMLSDRKIVTSVLIVGALNGIIFSYYAEGPFVFIQLIGLSPSQFGWLGMFIAIAALTGALISRKLIHRFSKHQVMLMGLGLMFISTVIYVLIATLLPINAASPISSTVLMIFPVMLLFFGRFGFLLPIILSEALTEYEDVLGKAGALFGTGYYLLVSPFTAIMGAIHNGSAWPMPVYFLCLVTLVALIYLWEHGIRFSDSKMK